MTQIGKRFGDAMRRLAAAARAKLAEYPLIELRSLGWDFRVGPMLLGYGMAAHVFGWRLWVHVYPRPWPAGDGAVEKTWAWEWGRYRVRV